MKRKDIIPEPSESCIYCNKYCGSKPVCTKCQGEIDLEEKEERSKCTI